MLFNVSRCENCLVKSAGERLTEILRAAAKANGGKLKSPRQIILKAGLTTGGVSNFVTNSKDDPTLKISFAMCEKLAAVLGLEPEELRRMVHPPKIQPGEAFPNKVKAAFLASEAGFSQSAIDAVLAEHTETDNDVWYWVQRMAAEAYRSPPLSGTKPR